MGKGLLKSKTFWLNILGITIQVASGGVISPKYAVPILGVANVITRLLTKEAITSLT